MMSKKDLISSYDSQSLSLLHIDIYNKIKKSAIVNIYTCSGECIKAKDGRHDFITSINSDFITLTFDSHITDIMFQSIERIEYYGGTYVRDNIE